MADHLIELPDSVSVSATETFTLNQKHRLTVSDSRSTSSSESFAVISYERSIDAVLTLPLIIIGGTIDDLSFDLELPLLEVSGTVLSGSAITGTLELPLVEIEGIFLPDSMLAGALTLPLLEVRGEIGDFDASIDLPLLEVAGEFLSGSVMDVALTLPILQVTAEFTSPAYLDAALVLPLLQINATIGELDIPVGVLTFPMLQVSGEFLNGNLATGDLVLPIVEVSGEATVSTELSGALILPLIEVYGYIPDSVVLTEPDGTSTTVASFALVLNVEREGVTEYTNFPFNSFAEFEGHYLAAGESGIYELTGGTDAGDNIEALYRTPMQDASTSFLKHPEDVYIGAISEDDLKVTILADGNVEYEGSIISGSTTKIVTRKSKIGKGIKSRYWAVQIENVNGGDFMAESEEIVLKPVARKIVGG